MKKKLAVFALVFFSFVMATQAQWKEPADKKITEDQLKTYIATANDWFDEVQKMAASMADSTTDAGKLAALGDLDAKQQACFDRHHISKAEFDWVAQQTIDAYNYVTTVNDILRASQDDLHQKLKENEDKLADAKTRLTAFQAASVAGTRMLLPEDRDALAKSDKDDQQTALDEVKQHQDEAKAADDETAQHEADAKAADALAKNPPADVTAKDRADYIQGKKNDANAARDAANDFRSRSADAKRATQEAMQRATTAASRAAHPELPLTDDEKTSTKADNEAGIAQAKQDIETCNTTKERMAQFQVQLDQTQKQFQTNIPDENIALVKKHQAEIKQLLEHMKLIAATQPAKQ